jgi:DNA-binding transcriptional ArsR family regulator
MIKAHAEFMEIGNRMQARRSFEGSAIAASVRSSICRTRAGWGEILLLTINTYLYKLLVMHSLDAAFSALADPTRRAILARLANGEATVNELAEPFEMTQPAISQHLKVLEDAGLIVRRVEGTKRPRRLAKAGIEAMDQWLAMLRKALETNYERLDEVLAGMEKHKKGKKP